MTLLRTFTAPFVKTTILQSTVVNSYELTSVSRIGIHANFSTSPLLCKKIDLKSIRETQVDWERQARLGYCVLDPVDSSQGLLYMTESEYLKLNRTCISSGIMLTVVARPGDEPPVTSSSTPTPPKGVGSK